MKNIDKKKVPFYLTLAAVALGFLVFMLWLKVLPHQAKLLVPGDGTYTGQMVNGSFEGQGTFISVSGVKYVGEWHKGEYDGYGTMTFANGSTYSGYWSKGLMHGRGRCTTADGNTTVQVWDRGHLRSQRALAGGK